MTACASDAGGGGEPKTGDVGDDGSPPGMDPGGGNGGTPGDDPGGPGGEPLPSSLTVHLIPQGGVSGQERVNFAIPLQPGQLTDGAKIRVYLGGSELAAARRVLAVHADGSARSVQIQVDLDITGETDLEITVGAASEAGEIDLAPVSSTLVDPEGELGPRVWALLPASWLSASGVAGPLVTEASVDGTPSAAWAELCDYASWNVDAFLSEQGDSGVWLYDRGTAMYRGHARQGSLVTLESAYRETAIYRNGISGSGGGTGIAVPGKNGDLKYYYAQNLAIHYLLTGDDRFRESAETMAGAAAALWPNPAYDAGTSFWTERHAGFALLAYVWAAIVSDDQAEAFSSLADEAVAGYVETQETYPTNYDDPDARCFAHHADAHGEPYGYYGCSPWMSAILADGLDAYARERAGAQADAARSAIVKLGRILARDGRDGDGRPLYWMGVGTSDNEPDDYDEHWGESAYVVSMAWFYDGKRDAALKQAADELTLGFRSQGEVGQIRSFNWQCRSAVATPSYLE